jgi:hypothetical protein
MKPRVRINWGQWLIGFDIDMRLGYIGVYFGPIALVW